MAISKGHSKNLDTLIRAAKAGRLSLMECTEGATGHLCPGDPYEAYVPPE